MDESVGAVPALHVEVAGRSFDVPAGASWLVGRVAEADIQVADDRVSREHADLLVEGGRWLVRDRNSTNGLHVSGRRVSQVVVPAEGVEVCLGGAGALALRLVPAPALAPRDLTPRPSGPPPGPPPAPGQPTHEQPTQDRAAHDEADPDVLTRQLPEAAEPSQVYRVQAAKVRIGRSADNDLVLADLLVSRHHAELEVTVGRAQIVDQGSENGTFVNGARVDRHPLAAGDSVAIGRHRLRFDGTHLLDYEDSGDVGFAAAHVGVSIGAKRLLADVSFTLGPRTLMAIVGPSGAGKSTLLGALTGTRPASTGTVLYAGRDLYREYADLRQRLGLVPQQDILHAALTLRQALRYGAELRFPADTTAAEREARITEVVSELSLTGQVDTRISAMSGGERKRASTALELLTKPSLLFLDEPTSGLDTDLDREVMQRLRTLADDGRTVVVVTHNLQHIAVCDLVMVLARGGHVAYLGPPGGAFARFGVQDWADVFGRLKERPGEEWAAEFAASPGRDARADPPDVHAAAVRPDLTPARRRSTGAQLSTLVRRYLAVTGSDRTLLMIMLLLPAVLALMARVVPAPNGLASGGGGGKGGTDARQLLLVLAVGAALMGAASAVRELVKERPIYQRERAIGLSAAAYVASKVVVLTGVAVLQGVLLTLLALAGRPGPDEANVLGSGLLEVVVAVAALTAVAAMLGLVVSGLVRDENQAMPLLVLVTMAQLVLCGGLVPLAGRPPLEQISWLVPARWGFGALASTVDLGRLERGQGSAPDGLWTHSAGTWLGDLLVLAVIGAVAVGAVAALVRRLDPQRR